MRLRGVGRRYGLAGPWVLRAVDLDVPRGALIRVEGANGSGKSTLLRLLAGIDAPTEGRVTGRPRTAYVPERFPAALPFTAAGYVTRLGRIHGLGRRAAEAAALGWLERLGAAGHARTPLGELSKGTCQKVAVAQAFVARPELLVLDEAWTGLDAAARAELDLAVAGLVAEGASVVCVDHDRRRPAEAGDTVLVVREGRVVRAAPGASTVPGDTGRDASALRPPAGPAGDTAVSRSAVRGGSGVPPAPTAAGRAVPPDAEEASGAAVRPGAVAGGEGVPPARIVAVGPRGAGAPGGLPGEPVAVAGGEGVPPARIVAVGPPGARVPGGLPGEPVAVAGEDGATVFTIAAADSDALLRALLTARPPWHVRQVETAPAAHGEARP
ncbi:ATP-binding cassette domain-containing protein [Streptomyces zhihengii]|uniref:ATP-binding cassette domain-containing protein n=1 Tax=Streptomyces zhihengii TaxID=1818004 RepID=A0ABS2UM96_9ACTN|nr:ATP-binding cassette domain-containing protein [Streptomyces zhihengii]